jgi:hypothetical protein
MSGHTHLNLLDDVKDSVDGRLEGLEGRFGRGPMGARDIGVSHWRHAPNLRNPMGHKHREQEEAYLVVAGSGQILLDGDVTELRQWDLVRVAPRSCGRSRPGPRAWRSSRSAGRKPEGGDGETAPVSWPE